MADLWNTISKMTQEELAGTVSEPAAPAPMPTLLATKIKAVVARLVNIEHENGYLCIARSEGIPKALVLEIERLRKRALSDLAKAAVVEEIE